MLCINICNKISHLKLDANIKTWYTVCDKYSVIVYGSHTMFLNFDLPTYFAEHVISTELLIQHTAF